MLHKLYQYKSLIFDCDGVVLNSNKVKSEAFYQAVLPYGDAAAQTFIDYHVAHGGISRYKKFAYFLEELLPSEVSRENKPNLEQLLAKYAEHVLEGLLSCEVAEGLEELRAVTPEASWLIVSGGDQSELRQIFLKRGLTKLFNGGIFGSPDTKDQILSRELASNNIIRPALFIGDSKYDYQAAMNSGLDFMFLSNWTEVEDWQQWVKEKQIVTKANISMMLNPNFNLAQFVGEKF